MKTYVLTRSRAMLLVVPSSSEVQDQYVFVKRQEIINLLDLFTLSLIPFL